MPEWTAKQQIRRSRHEHSVGQSELTIHVGEVHVSKTPLLIKTILGSCISACLYDPLIHIGGMNHFLLPGDIDNSDLSTRYGVNAMEVLINEMMKLGANRNMLKAKIFGGADIFQANHTMMMIGNKNIQFVRTFLSTEKIDIVSEHVGGNNGLIVHFDVGTFNVFVKSISSKKFLQTEKEEQEYRERMTHKIEAEQRNNITLF
jgi:chemotaxis receptor (MCP) glutamine deamidase CheD